MYTKDNIGERIKARRQKLGMTQEELASKINNGVATQRTQISQWEKGKKTPETDALIRLCNALACDMDYLLGAIETPTKAVHDVAKQTGLDAEVAEYLIQLKRSSDIEKGRKHNGYIITPESNKLKALNYILRYNSLGEHDFLSTLHSLIFGKFSRFSIDKKTEDGDFIIASANMAALVGSESEKIESVIRIGDIQNIFLLNLQEFLLDLRDKAQGEDRRRPKITLDFGGEKNG